MMTKIVIGLLVFIIITIVFLISTPGVNMLADTARSNWEIAPWAPGLLFKSGSIAFLTLRYEKALNIYSEFLDKCGSSHKLSSLASFRMCKCYLQLERNVDAANELLWFMQTFPNDPNYADAEGEYRILAHIPSFKSL